MHVLPLLAAETLPININELVGVCLGLLVVIIPVAGLTIRFAAKPFVDALQRLGVSFSSNRALEGAASQRQVDLLANRVLELEQEVAKLKGVRALPAPAMGVVPVAPVGEGRSAPTVSGDRLEQ